MSKSRGNIVYTDDLLTRGVGPSAIRFFLIDNHFRKRVNYSDREMSRSVDRLADLRRLVLALEEIAGKVSADKGFSGAVRIRRAFVHEMDDNLNVKSGLRCAYFSALRNGSQRSETG